MGIPAILDLYQAVFKLKTHGKMGFGEWYRDQTVLDKCSISEHARGHAHAVLLPASSAARWYSTETAISSSLSAPSGALGTAGIHRILSRLQPLAFSMVSSQTGHLPQYAFALSPPM
jgi:hypothetical protein